MWTRTAGVRLPSASTRVLLWRASSFRPAPTSHSVTKGARGTELSQEPAWSFGTQKGGGAIDLLDRFSAVTCCIRCKGQELCARWVCVVDLGSLTNPGRDSRRSVARRRERKDFESARIQHVAGDLLNRVNDQVLGCSAGVGPPAAKGGALKQVQRQISVSSRGGFARDADQPRDRVGVAGRTVVEDFAQPSHSRDVVR